jgi:NAD(P)-dependent dehydrogenase (short-subunit alcohol dehydrogenase family)
MRGLRDRVAIVTGGTRGIGRAIVCDLVQRGSRMAFTYVGREDLARSLEEKTNSLWHGAAGFCADRSRLGDTKIFRSSLVSGHRNSKSDPLTGTLCSVMSRY